MTEHPDRLDLRSHDIAEDKRHALLDLFPEVRTEDGKIDFDRLKLALGQDVDVGRERYGMNWPGKADCFKTIQSPSVGTLLPCPEESVNFDTTENLIIEGDNLEVLKLLQKSYLGKVKMIYIDPPYNTGNDFIYPDNYTESLRTYLEYTGQVDDEGRKFGTNSDTDGRFHSRWLNMMYPRLYLARNLLREDGVIFVSIDDTEIHNLRILLNEVFGEENFIASVIWQKMFSPKNTARHFSEDHDYVVLYGRNADVWLPQLLPRTEEMESRYGNSDDDPRGPWTSSDLCARNYYSQGTYSVTCPSGRVISGPPTGTYWRISQGKFDELDREGRIYWGSDGNNMPRLKRYLSDVKAGVVPQTLWKYQDVGHTQEAKKELLDRVEFASSDSVFDTPKPTRLVERMLRIATQASTSDLILDFFAGSGATADSVLKLNKEDGGNRRFVLVQLPEVTGYSDYPTIADITKVRIRRAIQQIAQEDEKSADQLTIPSSEPSATSQDLGFRVFRLAESNFKVWDATIPHEEGALARQLDLIADHLREGRRSEDILTEILLKSGFPLTTRMETMTLGEGTICSVAEGAMLICLERRLTIEMIRAIANKKPERVVCLDLGFADNDQLKTNAVQIFKTKGITSFKTV